MKKITGLLILALLTVFSLKLSYAKDISKRFYLSPVFGEYAFDENADLKNTKTFGLNFGYYFSKKTGLEATFLIIKTKDKAKNNESINVPVYNVNFVKFITKIENKPNVYLLYGIAGRKKEGLKNGFCFGIGFREYTRKNIGVDTSIRLNYLLAGRIDATVLFGISYLFR